MAYTEWPIKRQFGNTIEYQYQVTGQGTPSSISLQPKNDSLSNILFTTFTIESTGASTWDLLPSGMADVLGCTYMVYVNDSSEQEAMSYAFPQIKATSQFGFGATLNQEILLRPEYGFVFNVSSIIDSSGSNNMAIMFKARGTLVDPSTTTPFT